MTVRLRAKEGRVFFFADDEVNNGENEVRGSINGRSVSINGISGEQVKTRGDEAKRQTRRTSGSPASKGASRSGQTRDLKQSTSPKKKNLSLTEQIANSGAASAAAMATAAVNAAVAMKTLDAPEVGKSYISLDDGDSTVLDEEGLPLRYDREAISQFWAKERGTLNKRWGEFVSKAVPFLSRLVTLFITEGKIDDRHIPELSRQARVDLQELGPTFIKLGQMMSVRPDVLPQATLDELSVLQDSVVPFETEIAVKQIERELGGPLGQFFTSISQEPVAAASLAQVYLATLNDGNDTRVAVKIQRPKVLSAVSKDLYVLRRAAEVFQGLVERFAPQQRTNYVALLNEWAIGFYTELDFANEASNQKKLRQILIDNNVKGVTVPRVYEEFSTRRVLVSEWMDGVKLSECNQDEIKEMTEVAQEAFLVQLFEEGFFHADPHPGNILRLHEPTPEGHRVALIDCGLMASIDQKDRDNMISAVIHLANKDYASLVDDFMKLKILPADSDRAAIIPLMDKALSPYVKGGGAKKYEEELKRMYGMDDTVSSQVGGFQAMTQDALTVLNDIPFSIPPYFAILGRAIITLEGIALTGDESYGIIMESYPFIARKLLREDRPEVQSALEQVLYSSSGGGKRSSSGGGGMELKFTRLLALLNNAAGAVSKQEGGAFVDLDNVPQDGLTMAAGLKFLLSDQAESLRNLLEREVDIMMDILVRQIVRKGASQAVVALKPPRPPALPFLGDVFPPSPNLETTPLPILLPAKEDGSNENGRRLPGGVGLLSMMEFVDLVAPKLSREEEIYAIGLVDAVREFFGEDMAQFVRGDSVLSTRSASMLLAAVQSGVLGRRDLLSNTAVKQLLGVANSMLGGGGSSSGVMTRYGLEELTEAVNELDTKERALFDDIISELIRRSIVKATVRLADVPRVL